MFPFFLCNILQNFCHMKRTLDYIHTYQIEIFQVVNKLKYHVMFVDSVVFVGFIDLLGFFLKSFVVISFLILNKYLL